MRQAHSHHRHGSNQKIGVEYQAYSGQEYVCCARLVMPCLQRQSTTYNDKLALRSSLLKGRVGNSTRHTIISMKEKWRQAPSQDQAQGVHLRSDHLHDSESAGDEAVDVVGGHPSGDMPSAALAPLLLQLAHAQRHGPLKQPSRSQARLVRLQQPQCSHIQCILPAPTVM